MIPYIFLYITIVCIGYIKFQNKKKINNICFIIIFLFMGFRYDVGWDFRWYFPLAQKTYLNKYSIFMTLKDLGIWDPNKFQYLRLEFFNKIIYKIAWYLENPQMIILIYSFLVLCFIKKGLDNERKFSIYPWVLFLSIPLFFFNFTSLMRQSVAIGMIFYSYKYIKIRDIKRYLILIFLANLFHSTAFFIIPQYFLYNLKLSKKKLTLIFMSSFFAKPLLIIILKLSIFSKYTVYVTNSIGEGGKIIYFLIIALGLLVLLFYDKLIRRKSNQYFISMIILGCFIYISLISLGHLGPRIAMYYLIYILYIGKDFIYLFQDKELTKGLFLFLNGALILFTLYGDLINPHRSQYVPYRINFSMLKGD
ncbi:MAG: EpsG family protein [Cetobacterium sp.]